MSKLGQLTRAHKGGCLFGTCPSFIVKHSTSTSLICFWYKLNMFILYRPVNAVQTDRVFYLWVREGQVPSVFFARHVVTCLSIPWEVKMVASSRLVPQTTPPQRGLPHTLKCVSTGGYAKLLFTLTVIVININYRFLSRENWDPTWLSQWNAYGKWETNLGRIG